MDIQVKDNSAQRDAVKVLTEVVNAANYRAIAEYEAQFPDQHVVIEWTFTIKDRKKPKKATQDNVGLFSTQG